MCAETQICPRYTRFQGGTVCTVFVFVFSRRARKDVVDELPPSDLFARFTEPEVDVGSVGSVVE